MIQTPLVKRLFFLCSFLFFAVSAAEAEYKDEISHLIKYVSQTQCTYLRNGTSYKGTEAAAHITKKYDYFKDEIHSAEDFIRLSATKSTMFNNLYYIQCQGSVKVPSSQWLLQELKNYRQKQMRP